MPRDLPMQTGQGPVLSSHAKFTSQGTSRPLLWPSSTSSVIPPHAVNSYYLSKATTWLQPPALSTSQAISLSCQVPPKQGLHPWGGDGILNHKGLKLSFLHSKVFFQLCFQAQESSRCPWVPAMLPALVSGQHGPKAHSPLGLGFLPVGFLPWPWLFHSSFPGFSLTQPTGATDPANPHSLARPSACSQPM